MTDPHETPEPVEPAPEAPLDETVPPVDVQQRDAGGASESAPLDKTTPKIDSFLGSQNPSGRRR